MKTTTCAVIFGCLLLMTGEGVLAADTVANKTLTAKEGQIAEVGALKTNDQLRDWVVSIKPAGGRVEPVHQGARYWDRSVRRDNQPKMQE